MRVSNASANYTNARRYKACDIGIWRSIITGAALRQCVRRCLHARRLFYKHYEAWRVLAGIAAHRSRNANASIFNDVIS
jgi:hypothetical protein